VGEPGGMVKLVVVSPLTSSSFEFACSRLLRISSVGSVPISCSVSKDYSH
jgi:hypothetical protein